MERNAREMTRLSHPEKLTAEQFARRVTEDLVPFVDNMRHLGLGPLYAEDWVDIWRAWAEMEHEK